MKYLNNKNMRKIYLGNKSARTIKVIVLGIGIILIYLKLFYPVSETTIKLVVVSDIIGYKHTVEVCETNTFKTIIKCIPIAAIIGLVLLLIARYQKHDNLDNNK